FVGIIVAPHPHYDCGFAAGVLIVVLVLLVGVLFDFFPLLAAILLSLYSQLIGHFAALNKDIRLRLHTPVCDVAKEHSGIIYYLRYDFALLAVASIYVRVPPSIHCGVAVNRGVTHILAYQCR